MLLAIFRFFARNPHFLVAAIVIYVFSVRQMQQDAELFTTLAKEPVLSNLFGYSPDQLNNLYKIWVRQPGGASWSLQDVTHVAAR
jgi:di/tricarboxylate transporter